MRSKIPDQKWEKQEPNQGVEREKYRRYGEEFSGASHDEQ
jgi:hypothetical protein